MPNEVEFIPEFEVVTDEKDIISVEKLAEELIEGTPSYEMSEEEKMNSRCIVVDVDGTLANVKDRLEFDEKGKLNWKKFFAEMDKDIPNEWCARLTQIYYNTGFIIHIVTARPEEYKKQTENWLKKYSIPYDFIHMRATKDNRQDSIVKKEILDTKLPRKELIEFVVDDRQQVVDMWRAEGLVCLQCNPHQF